MKCLSRCGVIPFFGDYLVILNNGYKAKQEVDLIWLYTSFSFVSYWMLIDFKQSISIQLLRLKIENSLT